MASANLYLKSTKNPSPIYLRFIEGRTIDLWVKTGLAINPQYWDKKNQKIRDVIDVPNRKDLNSKLAKLKIFVVDEYNLAFSNGVIIDRNWIDDVIKKFFNRPAEENKLKIEPYKIYFTDFGEWWLKDVAPKFKVGPNKYMDEKTIAHYQSLLDNVIKYEGKNKIKFRDITSEVLDDFSLFLCDKEDYSPATAKRKLGRFKFFCQRAEELNFEVNKGYKSKVFVKAEDMDYLHPYLNEDEIEKIFKLDLTHDQTLDNVRDNLIIGLWTGLRISDFLTKLNLDFIKEDFIEIKTKKTGHSVAVPLHPQVKSILDKRGGLLPGKISEQKFNKYVKIIGQIAEIDEQVIGGVPIVDKDTGIKRKVVGTYKKYELMSSHICRRSFATNLFGLVSNKVIMDCAGWKSESQMLAYIKKTNRESANTLKEFWDNKVKM